MSSFFVNITLKPFDSVHSSLRVPVSIGSAFVTGIYTKIKPVLKSQIAFEDCMPVSDNTSKQLVSCNDGGKWVIYTWPSIHWIRYDMHTLAAANADDSWCGIVQIAKLPDGEASGNVIYDNFCGSWSEGIELNTSFHSMNSWVAGRWFPVYTSDRASGVLIASSTSRMILPNLPCFISYRII